MSQTSPSDREAKQNELQELRRRAAQLEVELASEQRQPRWQATEYYTAYYATTGFMLGMFGAVTSLLFNVVGSTLVGLNPLHIIKVYLTFPLGAKALELTVGDDRMVLALGCCLYLGTGMLLGIPFHLVLTRISHAASTHSLARRFGAASALGIVVWLVNFYGILSWLQPLLFGGRWIVDETPWYVGLLTHLVFGWTMALVYPLGLYTPYKLQTEQA